MPGHERDREVYLTGDLRTEQRWPEFAARATRETEVRSMLAVRLFLSEDTFGSLNLYSRRPDAFDDESAAVALLLATQAAVALSAARESERADDVTGRLRTTRREADRYQRQARTRSDPVREPPGRRSCAGSSAKAGR